MGSATIQGPLWGSRARLWAQLAEADQRPFYEAVFDALGVTDGTRLLDVGCGAGLAMQLAAERGSTVTGLDAAEGLLEIARERLPCADIRVGDMEDLPFPDASFTALTSFNAVQYATDPGRALRELARVAYAGTPIGIVTWGDPKRSEMRDVLAAIGQLLPPSPPGSGGPFALSAPGALEALVQSAGLTPQHAAEVPTPYTYPDVDTAVRAQSASGPAVRAAQHAGQEALHNALTDVMTRYRKPDGTVCLNNIFRYVVATN
jgi:SAM-dependent methyltransferase